MSSQQSLTFTLNLKRGVLQCPKCNWEFDVEIVSAVTGIDLYQLTDIADDHLQHSRECRR
jgi:transcription elongation factor Elf1